LLFKGLNAAIERRTLTS